MNRRLVCVLACVAGPLAILGLTGCGGGGGSTSSGPPSPFAGSYSGNDDETLTTTAGQTGSGSGTLNLTVYSNGSIRGSTSGSAATTNISGSINANGNTRLTFVSTYQGLTGRGSMSGVLSLSSGDLSGTLYGTFHDSNGVSGTSVDELDLPSESGPALRRTKSANAQASKNNEPLKPGQNSAVSVMAVPVN